MTGIDVAMPSTGVDNEAQFTDARHSKFIHVVGNQHISNMSSSAESLFISLKPVRHQRFVTPYMEGTRKGVFRKIDSWLDDFDTHNILWISGSPGVGKSVIMSSLEPRLRMIGRFGASFFFDRGNVSLSDPTALWRTVAFDLARKFPLMEKRLAKNLQDDKVDPGRPNIKSHFRYLIQDPLSHMWVSTEVGDARKEEQDTRKGETESSDGASLATEEQLGESESIIKPPVILIDALDECGSDDSQSVQRNILLNTLTYWLRLHPSIQLVVTSRDERIPPPFADVYDHIVLETRDPVSSEENDDIVWDAETSQLISGPLECAQHVTSVGPYAGRDSNALGNEIHLLYPHINYLQIDIDPDANRVSHNLMPLASQIFTGRGDSLEQLGQYFCQRDICRPRRHFLLYGVGGVGKTQICLKFLEEHTDR
jgi:hypothetical protein